jgi:hypothetical protein
MRSLRSGLLAIVAGAALLAAACSSGSSSPQVASLGKSTDTGSGSTSAGNGSGNTTGATGNPTQLLNEWAACMRSHGDPTQADPTIDASKVIHITILASVPGGYAGKDGQTSSGPGTYCVTYLTGASTALRGGQPAPAAPGQAKLLRYAQCMRANGISDFPDPTAGGFVLSNSAGNDLSASNPALQAAAKTCAKKTGVQPVGGGGPLPAGSIMSGSPGGIQSGDVPISSNG